MEKTTRDCNHPICILAHQLVNNLSAIVGYCDLSQDPGQSEQQRTERVAQIRETAKSMAEKLNHHQCQLVTLARSISSQEERRTIQREPPRKPTQKRWVKG